MPKSIRAKVAVAAAVAATLAVVGTGVTLFALMVDETHFDRPDPAFDALAADLAAIDGVSELQRERWVEAPTFADPSANVHAVVDAFAWPDVFALACSPAYPDAVAWSFEIVTPSGARVHVAADAAPGCPDLGFDVPTVVGSIDRVAPGRTVQAALWEGERFSVSMPGVDDEGAAALLPLVAEADHLRAAANTASDVPLEIAGPLLGIEIRPGEGPAYHALLTRLLEDHGATGFFAGGAGKPVDGVEKVQISAPEAQHAAITREVAASGLPIATLPVSFLP
ncbi:hypothetical protein LG315_03475 [Microbacterium marinum]|uniref:hypothetical protein n=1 Tax=Microbacterium marinum TaxID=421115 RepID=UPI00384CAE63